VLGADEWVQGKALHGILPLTNKTVQHSLLKYPTAQASGDGHPQTTRGAPNRVQSSIMKLSPYQHKKKLKG